MKNNQSVGVYIIVAIIAAIIACMAFLGPTTSTDEISYSQFLKKVQLGEISSVLISKDTLYAVPKVDNKQTETKENTTSKNEFLNSLAASQKAPEIQYKVTIPSDTDSLYKVLEENSVDINVKKPQEGSILSTIGSILVPVFFIIMIIFILKGIQQGGSAAMNFGKSRAKMLQESKVKITFNDVAGIDEERQELEEIVDFLKNPEKYTKLGAKIPKGVLLVGAPGTGKTLMAKAVAGEAGVPFFSISGSDFVEMFVGVGASRVRDLFEQAKKHQPCIIFIDEIDAVGRQRGAGLGGGHDEREQTLNQLLVEMDGFQGDEGVIVMAATNRSDVLDPALLRPGRFDRKILVGRPDVKGREAILRVHAKNKPLADDVDLKEIAKQTPGFVGADLANLLNEAALLAARRNKTKIDAADLDEAEDRVIAGPAKHDRVESKQERRTVAYHEAGHTIVGLVLNDARVVHKVTIVPRGRAGGYAIMLPREDQMLMSKKNAEEQIAGLMGGRAAEELIFKSQSSGASNDFEQATQIARAMVTQYGMSDKIGPVELQSSGQVFTGQGYDQAPYSEKTAALVDEEVRRILREGHEQALHIIETHREQHKLIAEALLKYETLDEKQILSLYKTGKLPDKDIAAADEEARAQTFEESKRALERLEDEKHSNATEQLKASSSATDEEATQAADTPNSEAADAPTSASDADSDSDHSDAPDERDK